MHELDQIYVVHAHMMNRSLEVTARACEQANGYGHGY